MVITRADIVANFILSDCTINVNSDCFYFKYGEMLVPNNVCV